MTVFVTGRTGKTEIAAFLCIITKGMKGLKIEKKYIEWQFPGIPGFCGIAVWPEGC